MGPYLLRRLLISIPVLWGISVIGFAVLALTPGDPLLARIPDDVLYAMTDEQIAELRAGLGLDKPIPVRYLIWLGGVLRGDLGASIVTKQAVIDEMAPHLGPTALLMGSAIAAAVLVGLPLGVISAVRQYGRLDYALAAFTVVTISVPTFVMALIFIYVFGVNLRLFPIGGMSTPGTESSVVDLLAHLAMPVTILALVLAAPLTRYTRASVLEVLASDYVRTARAKGLMPRVVLLRHALRTSLLPIITLVGLMLPEVVGGAVIIEQVFAWPGMGQLAVRAASDRDPALMMGVMMLVATAVVLSSIVADIAYVVADPRVRLGRR